MFKTILVDDERMSLEVLAIKLRKLAPEMEILATYQSAEEAVVGIRQLKPDVLFLDIEMPQMDGFTVLRRLEPYTFEVVFTTAYTQYAIEAIRQSALDFLLKPVREIELSSALQRLEKKLFSHRTSANGVSPVPSSIQFNKIAVPSLKGVTFVPIQDIVWLESDSNYTVFHLANVNGALPRKIVASRMLKEFESMLTSAQFLRVHRSALINLLRVKEYVRGEGGTAIMDDGSEVEVARSEKKGFLEKLGL
ncbi:LytTR family DNA-binding domain-containing protein [Runella sp.]|jgi:two-component system LytT family response regulator|uniref:LytR/AlgR family response regulator transcription factor n=1 Tax=Runella sp. TaxID=1960881 RepID=UPI0030161307